MVFIIYQGLLAQGSQETMSFQDGVNGYNGTRDTKLIGDHPDTEYGDDNELELDGGDVLSSESSLLSWDLTSIPTGNTINSAEITLNVSNTSSDTYELYEMKRAWVEMEANWNIYASGLNWEIAGADGSSDRGSTVLGTISPSAAGSDLDFS